MGCLRFTSFDSSLNTSKKRSVTYPALFVSVVVFSFFLLVPTHAFAFSNPNAIINIDNANYPQGRYFQDHGSYINITETGCSDPVGCFTPTSTIQVTLTSAQVGGSGITVNFNQVPNTSTWSLPTNYVYFSNTTNYAARPQLQVLVHTVGSTNPWNDTVTITTPSFVISSTNSTFSVTPNDTDTCCPTVTTPQPTSLTADLNVSPGCSTGMSSKDGICNEWKVAGFGLKIPYTDPSGNTVTYQLPCGQGNPDPICPVVGQNDTYIEVDYLEGQKPSNAAIKSVVNAFANSPTLNTGGTPTGITLHVLVDESVPHHYDVVTPPSSGSAANTQWDILKQSYFGTAAERAGTGPTVSCPNTISASTCASDILTAKRQIFHYLLITHSQPSKASGSSELPGNDMDVSLGHWAGGTGTADDQAGTIMHEFGHNLALQHGGGDSINCKPNYLSVMSWARQFSSLFLPTIRPLDYSHEADPIAVNNGQTPGELIETTTSNQLDESVGVTASTGGQTFFYGSTNGGPYSGTTGIATNMNSIPWNQPTDTAIQMTSGLIHYIKSAGCKSTYTQILIGYNDWSHLQLNMWASVNGGTPSSMFDGAPG